MAAERSLTGGTVKSSRQIIGESISDGFGCFITLLVSLVGVVTFVVAVLIPISWLSMILWGPALWGLRDSSQFFATVWGNLWWAVLLSCPIELLLLIVLSWVFKTLRR